MVSFYGKLSAEVYDLDKFIGKSFGDVEYYSERLKDIKGRILEPAVGNGRILIPLLEKGLNIEGFDLSLDMLNLCKKHCAERGLSPRLSQLNMSDFSLEQRYEAIIVPTGSFLLLHQREDSLNALRCFYEHLEMGGRLILDLFLPESFQTGYVSTRMIKNQEGDSITLEEILVDVDQINQFTVTHNKYQKWRHSKLVDTELEYFPLRWYGVEEFRSILKNIGFRDVVVSSNYQFNTFPTNKNQIITYEAVKK
ncbi:SAM-dependent methyltransferase [Oikeobacillus pervagus]|uniref:SAM-dependent methyltransferase n=1 Tax=Oikeobacillus pervagus TaxID=1325931 RepID=A0AAJ1T140_9BACI|nr:class I SAM-dependent methyltransferase [Oikeobacillus pervagus]MDQ0214014.1 SAM-dependent methyltransferase [Oikeobacillus pervagus]